MAKPGFTYIMVNKWRTTLYVGVTSDLIQCVHQHRENAGSKFTTKYALNTLVWYEVYNEIQTAIEREKQLKNWRRDWKIALVEEMNPSWCDLYGSIAHP